MGKRDLIEFQHGTYFDRIGKKRYGVAFCPDGQNREIRVTGKGETLPLMAFCGDVAGRVRDVLGVLVFEDDAGKWTAASHEKFAQLKSLPTMPVSTDEA